MHLEWQVLLRKLFVGMIRGERNTETARTLEDSFYPLKIPQLGQDRAGQGRAEQSTEITFWAGRCGFSPAFSLQQKASGGQWMWSWTVSWWKTAGTGQVFLAMRTWQKPCWC